MSRTSIKFVFRRRIEYHIKKTFLQVCNIQNQLSCNVISASNLFFQTFIIVMIGYMSFYFDIEDFTDRAMVVLTTLLVVVNL